MSAHHACLRRAVGDITNVFLFHFLIILTLVSCPSQGDYALTTRVIDRIMSQVPRRFRSNVEGNMGFEDFIGMVLVCFVVL